MSSLTGYFTGFLFFLCGLAFGSFGNVLIYRLPLGRTIRGRSQCPHCGRILEIRDLIPIVSFLLLRGRCRSCRAALDMQYPLVELLSGILALLALSIAPSLFPAGILAFALWVLLLLAVIDARTQGIPDVLSAVFIAFSLLYSSLVGQLEILAFVVGAGFFGLQWLVSRGRWIGSGDILLAVGLSALLGAWESVVSMLFIAYISGALTASVLLLLHRIRRQATIAFGPFLALATLVVLLMGDRMIRCLPWGSPGVCAGT